MKLTDKAKKTFWAWYCLDDTKAFYKQSSRIDIKSNAQYKVEFLAKSDTEQMAIILDWFDSIGIRINITSLDFQNWWSYEIKWMPPERNESFIMQKTRGEITNLAILKANDLYNQGL